MPLKPGARLANYEILGSLGAGGMGEVHRARDLRLGREVAIKVISGDAAPSEEQLARLEREARAAGIRHIDVQAFDLRVHSGWVLPAWEERLAELLAYSADLDANDRAGIEDLAARIEELTFVAEIGVPEVIWPDGLSLPLRLHIPAANLRVGESFLLVSEEGVVLAGASTLPHEAFGLPLPVLGPLDGSTDRYRPGDSLDREDLLDALAVARSMWLHLDAPRLARLGRVLIDASA
ncbi:MAG: hypothetical protein KC591_15920, partial [Gemmatimonadetes bacterium]|nr:hypothetical protein [Gemmatimonadota bacterium]